MILNKSVAFEGNNFEFKSEKGTFEGYASVFDVVDYDNDVIEKGAYSEIVKSGAMPKMFFNHETWEIPFGSWKAMSEDSHGLLVSGKFNDSPRANEIKAALSNKALDGLSVGIGFKREDFSVKDGVRHISKIASLNEISVVTFPANTESRVSLDSIKGDIDSLESIKDMGAFIRTRCNLSRAASTALVAKLKSIALAEQSGVEDEAQVKALAEQFRSLKLF